MKHVNFVSKDVQRILSSHKSIINRKCFTRKLFLKILQHSQERNLFFNKNSGFQLPPSFIKKRLEHRCCEHWQIFKNTYFEEHLRTAVSESFTWTFPIWTNNMERKEDVSSKIKQNKNHSKTQLYEKNLPFHDVHYHFVFLFSPLHVRRHLPCIIKYDTTESFETA